MRLPLETRSAFLDVETAEGHLRFRITGDYSFEDLEMMIPAMLGELTRHGHARALVDISDMTGEMPDLDRFTLAETFVRVWGAHRRAAVKVDTVRQRINRLFETVALNRFGQVRVGDRSEELMAWLLAD